MSGEIKETEKQETEKLETEKNQAVKEIFGKIGKGFKKVFGAVGRFAKKHKIITVLLVIILIIAIVGVTIFTKINKARQQASQSSSLMTTSLEKMDLTSSISVTGTIASADSRSITTTLTGTDITEVNVAVGDYVNAGDTIITFDTEDLEDELETAQDSATLNSLKSSKSIDDASDQITDAQDTYNTQAAEQANNVSSAQNTYNSAVSNRDNTLAEYQAAQAETVNAQAALDAKQAEATAGNWETAVNEAKATLDAAQAKYDEAAAVTDIDLTSSIYQELQAAQAAYDTANAQFSQLNQAKEILANAQAKEAELLNKYNSLCTEVDSTYAKYQTAVNNQTTTNTKNAESIEDAQYNYKITALEQSNTKKTQSSQVQDAEEKLGKTVVTSPISGVITSVGVEVGDTYNGEVLFVVQDMEHFIVDGSVDEYDIASISKDLTAVIKTEATDDDEFSGVVTFVAPTPDSSASTTSSTSSSSTTGSSSSMGSTSTTSSSGYDIQITLSDTDDRLRVGMTAKTSIILDSREDVFAVAYDCVETDADGNSYITVVDDGSSSESSTSSGKEDKTQNTGAVSENGMGGQLPEGMEAPADGEMPEGMEAPTDGEMPDMSKADFAGNSKSDSSSDSTTQSTKKIYVTIGMESDYYEEIISDELYEGMQIVATASSATSSSSESDAMMGGMMNMGGGNMGGGNRGNMGGGAPGGF